MYFFRLREKMKKVRGHDYYQPLLAVFLFVVALVAGNLFLADYSLEKDYVTKLVGSIGGVFEAIYDIQK